MKTNYQVNMTPQFHLLTDSMIREIHAATLHVLEETGVKVESEQALALLKKAGALTQANGIVRIPSPIVEEAIRTAPKSVTIHHRDRKGKMVLDCNRVYFGTGSDCPFTYDLKTGERRRTTRQDTADFAVLADYLKNIHFVMSMGNCQDVPPEACYRQEFEAMVTHTTKPICFTVQSIEDLKKILKAAAVIAGGVEELRLYPFCVLYNEPISPLTNPRESVEKLLHCAETGIPIIYSPGMSAGGTGPVTLAGSVAQANAEILSGLVIHQLKAKGSPFIYGATITILDMSTGNFTHGTPEHFLMSVARAELAHSYGLPIFGVGGRTDSNSLDLQTGIEYALSAFLEVLSGAGMIHDVGYISTGLVSSHEMVIMGNEIAGMIERIMRGITVTPETLAEKVIWEVGPGGQYVTHEHTLNHFRKEFWTPEFMNRDNLYSWEHKEKPQLADKLKAKAQWILKEHQPSPLAADVLKEISEILT
jgi:trimethylamine--corrinoid protein Co-methyltransferase